MNALSQKVAKAARLRWLPWVIVGLTLVIALLHEIFQPPWMGSLSRSGQAAFWSFVLLVLVLSSLLLNRLVFYSEERQALRRQVEEAERLVAKARQRLQAIFRISQKYVEASDENEVIELVLHLSVELVGATGASFVPLDEHGQPLSAISFGNLPFPVANDWVEYLASPTVRDRCRACESHAAPIANETCPLLKGPFSEAIGLFCVPLRRSEREFGMLNLYLPDVEQLDPETQDFLRALVDETALALEGVRLRRRELAALRQMQAVREKTDLPALLKSLLEDVHQTLESEFALLVMQDPAGNLSRVAIGVLVDAAGPFVDAVLQGVLASGKPVLLGEVAGDPPSTPGVKSLLVAPLLSPERAVMGAVLVGNQGGEAFHQRQLSLLQTIAGQVALVIQNANLMAELEYRTVVEERTRLAREIHDGLAQTLGFLKLQTAQMKNYLARNELDRLSKSTELCYATLSEAYQDARQAIDGLRIWPSENGLAGWLEQTVEEFQEISDVTVILEDPSPAITLPPEVHAQLIRVVQEALSNVRKHAQAERVWISCRETGEDLCLEIRDDGNGFSADDLPGHSRHGLRGMRERAELVGADFQVISRPREGTTVRLRLPLVGARFCQPGEVST